MNALEIRTLTNSLADKCFEKVEVVDEDMGIYIVKHEGKYCVVRINVCKEYPAELIERFSLKRKMRQEKENRKLMAKLKEMFT
jgi:hypothetical protein